MKALKAIAMVSVVVLLVLILETLSQLVGVTKSNGRVLRRILKKLGEESPPETLEAVAIHFIFQGKKVDKMNLKVTQQLPISIKPVDVKGNLASVDGIPAWSLTDEALGSLEVAADGMSATFKPKAIGSVKVQVHADADLGEGVKDLLGELLIDIFSGEAVSITISAGEPTDMVDAEPSEPAPAETDTPAEGSTDA